MFSAQASQVSSDSTLYVEDVFSAYIYTGNGGTQNIVNGVDLAGKGGLVWTKNRSIADSHRLWDTMRGPNSMLMSDRTDAAIGTTDAFNAFNSNGFSLGADAGNWVNVNGKNYVSWTFRKAPKFFDVVTWTGDGTDNRAIAHALGVAPGLIVVKATNAVSHWTTYHRGLSNPATKCLLLNTTDAEVSAAYFPLAPTATNFYVNASTGSGVNQAGNTYIAYLFAHDTTASGIVQCGTFSGGTNVSVSLGWEPQYVMYKLASGAGDWKIHDTSRGSSLTTYAQLLANTSGAETAGSGVILRPTATGFLLDEAAGTYVYLAIRRGPMRAPTSGTQVYSAVARTGTGAAATVTGVGFPPDLVISKARNNAIDPAFYDRLRGPLLSILSSSTDAEASHSSELTSFDMDGASVGGGAWQYVNASGWTYIHHFLRRYPGVFDEVCYTGTGSATTVAHNLGVVPELMIVKRRDGATADWPVYAASLGINTDLALNQGIAAGSGNGAVFWNSATPTSSVFSVGTYAWTNLNGYNYVAYLFATLAGISKVGSYTGNGASQTINCGFAAGARFALIKRTDAAGDWYVWDSTRGIIAANDPHLSLNTTAAEVTTDDSVDPDSSGFIVNQNATTNINVNTASYIYLAFA